MCHFNATQEYTQSVYHSNRFSNFSKWQPEFVVKKKKQKEIKALHLHFYS